MADPTNGQLLAWNDGCEPPIEWKDPPSGTAREQATTVVSETGWGQTPSVGVALKDAREDHTHGTPADPGGGGAHAMGGANHTSDTIANIRTKCSDATIETTAGSATAAASAVSSHESTYAHANLPTNDQKAALAGTSGTPSVSNKYVTDTDARNANARTPTTHTHAGADVTSAVANATDAANAASVEWTGVQNKPSTFAPTAHGSAAHTGTIGSWSQINKTVSDLADLTTKSHTSLSDKGTNTHATIDTHLSASAPHGGHEVTSAKGAASGYCPLDTSSMVPDANIPAAICRDSELSTHAGLTTGTHGVGASTVDSVSARDGAITSHAGLGTGIHGVGASTVESASGAQGKVDAHKDLTTGVHGAGASALATTANIATHAGVSASVHNADASGNSPAQSHANEKHSTAMALASDLSTHAGLTTSAHGGLIASAEKGAASGVASLNASSKVVQDCANPQTPAAHDQAATTITTGTLDGDRLPAPSTTKRGGVKATGTPAGLFLRDDDTWAAAGGGAHDLGGASHNADTLANLNLKISDADVVALAGQIGGTAASPDVRGLRESGGGLRAMGAVADLQYLQWTAGGIIGAVPTAALPELVQTRMTSTADQTVTAGYAAYIPDAYEIASGFATEIGIGSVMEVG